MTARSPGGASRPMGILLLLVPAIAVGQFRGIALAATLGFVAAILEHRRAYGRLPWPGGATTLLALLPPLWCLATAAWAEAPGRAATTALSVGGFVLLGAATARALSEEPPARLERMMRLLAWGLALGILLAFLDQVTGNALRAAVRGMRQATETLYFGLKPAGSVIAVLLPLVPFLPVPRWARAAMVLGGLVTLLLLPASSAKIAALVGLAALAAAWPLGPWVARGIGMALAAGFVATPLVFGAALPRLPSLETVPPSAAHRILIWDFALARIAERPLTGWGGEASRAVPGGRDTFDIPTLDRFGLSSPGSRAWFARPEAQRLPLHTHNAMLQVWLELGGVGAALAALLVLRLGWVAGASGPAGAGVLAAAVTVGMLSYGIWQEWWIGLLLILVAVFAAFNRLRAASR